MKKLTRTDVNQLIASGNFLNFQDADLSNLDLSKLNLSEANL